MKTWLLIDVNYLGYRALYSTGKLSYKGMSTGVIFGILKSVFQFQKLFKATNLVWCFDFGPNKRKDIYKGYKGNRKTNPDIEDMKEQVTFLRKRLKKYFLNVLYSDGFEADDKIAQAITAIRQDAANMSDKIVIISADHDMYQLLTPQVSVYDPRASFEMTYKVFVTKYGIKPKQWVKVKAVAGCTTDNVKGAMGIGEKTMARFIAGKLVKQSKAYDKIIEFMDSKKYKKNRRVIKLPLDKTQLSKRIHRDEVFSVIGEEWFKVCEGTGINVTKW